jgi:mRNA interferase RelE/StbE
MKTVRFSAEALADLRKQRSHAKRLIAKIERYAASGAGDVKKLVGEPTLRLRIGDFRVLFVEDADAVIVLRIKPRGEAYE